VEKYLTIGSGIVFSFANQRIRCSGEIEISWRNNTPKEQKRFLICSASPVSESGSTIQNVENTEGQGFSTIGTLHNMEAMYAQRRFSLQATFGDPHFSKVAPLLRVFTCFTYSSSHIQLALSANFNTFGGDL